MSKKFNRVKLIPEGEMTFIVIEGKYTIAVETGAFGISSRCPEDNFNEEVGKALAYYRYSELIDQ